MSVGKWKFVIKAWHESRGEVISAESSSPHSKREDRNPRAEPSTGAAPSGAPEEKDDPNKEAGAPRAGGIYTRNFPGELFDDDDGDYGAAGGYEDDDDDEQGGAGKEARAEAPQGVDTRNLERILETIETMKYNFEERLRHSEARVEAYRKQAQTADQRVTDVFTALQSVHNKTRQLEVQVAQATPNSDQTAQLDRVVFDLYNQQGSFMAHKNHFTAFREKLESGGGIDCNGVNFASKREFLDWFDEKGPPVAVFLDALAYLHSIRAAVVHQDDASKQREAQGKVLMESGLEASVMTSFDTILPSVLVGGKKITDHGGGTFDWLQGYLKTYSVWKPRGRTTGVSHQILDGVGKVTKRVIELRGLKTSDSEVILLSSGLCTDSATFCKELVQFINEQHEELTADSAYSADEIWAMQLECLQTIISELSEAREAVVDAARHERAFYLWGMLRSWQIQQRYLSNHFKNDPALTGILVRRILMHGGDTTLKSKLGKIDELTRKVDDHHRNFQAELKKLQAAKKP